MNLFKLNLYRMAVGRYLMNQIDKVIGHWLGPVADLAVVLDYKTIGKIDGVDRAPRDAIA